MKKLAAIILAALAATSYAGPTYEGEAAAKLLVGNTVEGSYRAVGDTEGRHAFYEYYSEDGKIYGGDKVQQQGGSYTHYVGSWEIVDGKFCTSVYDRTNSCNSYEKVDDNTYKQNSDTMVFRDVVIHEGKYHPNK